MTDLDQVAPPDPPRGRQTPNSGWYRSELERQRRFRLDQLTDLAYDAMDTSDESLGEVTATLMTAARAALADVDAALFRLAIGRFGNCQRCGRVIPEDVLRAVPAVSLCPRCQLSEGSAYPVLRARRTGTAPSTSSSGPPRDIVEVWGEDSFPASDPPANW